MFTKNEIVLNKIFLFKMLYMCTYVLKYFVLIFFYEFNVDALNLGGVGETQLLKLTTILRTSIIIDDFNHLSVEY